MNRQEYKSEAYYQSITSISFTPVQILSYIEPKYRKGQVIRKRKMFGLVKEKIAETDLYRWYDELKTKDCYASSRGLGINENGDFILKAVVRVDFKKNYETYKFDTDDEAVCFINDIKNKCTICGNKLM